MSLETKAFLAVSKDKWKAFENSINPKFLFTWYEPLSRFVRKMELAVKAIADFIDAACTSNLQPTSCEILRSSAWSLELKRGDHVAVRRELAAGAGYWHHGIFCGSNCVIEFGPENDKPMDARATDFFEHDISYARVLYVPDNEEDAARVAELMRQGYGSIERYRLLDNNCEVFASRCKTGKGLTEQIDKMLDATVLCASKLAHAIKTFR